MRIAAIAADYVGQAVLTYKKRVERNMKKMIVFLMVLFVTAPAPAGIVVEATHTGGGNVIITYDVNGASELIRGFALNIEVDNGAVITSASNFNNKYNVYPGSIEITGSVVTNEGSPVCDPAVYPGTDTLGGIGTGGITIELAAVYDPAVGGSAPAASGTLCELTVNKSCTLTMTQNSPRKGIVMEDTSRALDALLKGCSISLYPEWECPGQASGDADCSGLVDTDDLDTLKSSWMKHEGNLGYNPAADFNRDGQINFADLAVIKRNYMQSP